MTPEGDPRFRIPAARIAPGLCKNHSPQKKKEAQATLKRREGAGNAGCPLHPQPRVQSVVSTRVSSLQVQRKRPAFPRNGFNGLLRALPGDKFVFRVIGGLRSLPDPVGQASPPPA